MIYCHPDWQDKFPPFLAAALPGRRVKPRKPGHKDIASMRSWDAGRLAKVAVMVAMVFATSGMWSVCASFYGHNTRVVLFLVYAPAIYGALCVLWWVIDSARARERQLVE